jgi:hypothetical protein
MTFPLIIKLVKIIKLVGLKNGGRLSPINLVTFADTQNGE